MYSRFAVSGVDDNFLTIVPVQIPVFAVEERERSQEMKGMSRPQIRIQVTLTECLELSFSY